MSIDEGKLGTHKNKQTNNVYYLSCIGAFGVMMLTGVGFVWFFVYTQIIYLISDQPPLPTPKVTATITSTLQSQVVSYQTSSPTITVTPTPTPSNDEMAQATLTRVQQDIQDALTNRDKETILASLDILEDTLITLDTNNSSLKGSFFQLRSNAALALDYLDETTYLSKENTTKLSLVTLKSETLSSPIDLALSDNNLYIINSGILYETDLNKRIYDELVFRPILTQNTLISGYPVKEIVAVTVAENNVVYVLDKANDIYSYNPVNKIWALEQLPSRQYSAPSPLYLNLTNYQNRIYVLDPARNQIWRHPPNELGKGYLPGTLPWLIETGEPDVNSAIDLAVDGNIYILQRDGVIVVYQSAEEINRFTLERANELSRLQGWSDLPTQPVAIFAGQDGVKLHVADRGRRRVVTFDRTTGEIISQLIYPDNTDFATLRGVAEQHDILYILTAYGIYTYKLNQNFPPSLNDELPILRPITWPTKFQIGNFYPDDPILPYLLAQLGFQMPLKEALLPDRSAVYPGARRAYRYGVHQGLDFYEKDVNTEVQLGTPVRAIGNGIIIRADVNYVEMTLNEVNSFLTESHFNHITSPDALEKLNGQQIWIDHGMGVVSRYSHLSGILEGIAVGHPITTGQIIGYVGLSGTPDGITYNTQFPHLHFEIRLGFNQEYYLGQWLTIEETRQAFEKIFDVDIHPAYSEFR